MSARKPSSTDLPPGLITQAAAWVARLHGPLRSPAVETGLRAWLQEHPDHGRALELVTESWDEVAAFRGTANVEVLLPGDGGRRRALPYGLAAVAALALLIGALLVLLRPGEFSTGVAEQRVIVLQDGSRVSLNASTRVRVRYNTARRQVVLESGEAYFEVAKNAAWPFVVTAGPRQVTALGTAFLVRRDVRQVAVTLVEGRVAVTLNAPVAHRAEHAVAPETVLVPGERATFVADQLAPEVDHPAVEAVTAWQRGKVPIDNLTLADAVAEMNRYSTVPLVVQRPEAAQLRVSGIFRAGDSESFANAVAESYGLEVERQPDQIVLTGLPRPARAP
jgi:transmembrane sensor